MISDATVLGVVSVKKTLVLCACVLSVLFTLVEPKHTQHLSTTHSFGFWILHIGAGMLCLMFASRLLRSMPTYSWKVRFPKHLAILSTGVMGAILVSPIYVMLELFFPESAPDDWRDLIARPTIFHAVIFEFADILPIFLSSWFVINIPIIYSKPQLNHPNPEPPTDFKGFDPDQEKRDKQKQSFYTSLPEVIGTDIIAISSDLHYLNVYTTQGKALVLGSIARCSDFMGEQGLLVHRSNWVAKKHVDRIVVSGSNAYCLMSTGLKVPISRSKRKEVKRVFGQSAHLTPVTQLNSNKASS